MSDEGFMKQSAVRSGVDTFSSSSSSRFRVASLPEDSIYPPAVYHKLLDYRVAEIVLMAVAIGGAVLFFHLSR